ncbi:flagellar biosynthetic protein FliR [Bosea sp. OAE752]|uniref:Flagellar biosynthetic protein FliR n=1 Tax=Bosea spartocytisi TaxID=2773451 RepID=A0A927I2Z0_9HYPH|nr:MULTISPECIES: flagellar biosynthetic protein FliR [Bosea]MBD3849536.1 flagellar type III secretion system protein FliR [Bosea spartocytisi]MCT4471527.1 flagellar biosynthetic protein FliR [Bosea spartocytisi]
MQIAILPQIGALFVLVFARVGTLVMLMPGIGERFIFSRARLSLAFFIALMILPMARPSLQIPETLPALATLLIGELLIGLVIGVCARLVMAALQTAGTIVAQSMGLGFAMTVDPTGGNQNPSIGNFLTMLGITLILTSDLHHIAIAAIHESYRLLPPGGAPDLTDVMTLAVRSTAQGFALAVQIAAPFIVFGLLFNLGLGVLARMMPQLQVFFLAVPASIFGGMLMLLVVLGVMMSVFMNGLGVFLRQFTGG